MGNTFNTGRLGNGLFVDANGNVGIGTSSPTEKLSIIGNIKIDNGYADGGQLILASLGYSDWNIDNYSGRLRAYYNATEYFTITSSGNVGIGTSSPVGELHVKASSGFSELYVQGASSTTGMYLFDNNTESGLWKVDSGYMAFATTNIERMRITSTGSIGIGTGSPLAKLTIGDANGVTDSFGQMYVYSTDAQAADKGGQITMGGLFSGSRTAFGAIAARKTNSTSGDSQGYLSFGTNSGSAITERLRIAADGEFLFKGGTNSIITQNMDKTGWSLYRAYANSNAVEFQIRTGVDGAGNYVRLGNYTSNDLLLMTGATERMRITSAGNVGIGTSSPSYRLDTYASNQYIGRFDTSDTTGGFVAFAKSNTATGYIGSAYHIVSGTQSSNDLAISAVSNLIFGTGSSLTEKMRILGTGGHILMHSTAFDSSLNGQLFGADGDTYFTRTSGSVLYLNRKSTNGTLLIFQVDGSTTGSISTNTYSLPSDRNLKSEIENIELGLNFVSKLRPVSYKMNYSLEEKPKSTGFIAQEMEEALRELGVEDNSYFLLQYEPNEKEGESQYWVDYSKMIPILTKAIQEQQEIINQLSAKVTALENK